MGGGSTCVSEDPEETGEAGTVEGTDRGETGDGGRGSRERIGFLGRGRGAGS